MMNDKQSEKSSIFKDYENLSAAVKTQIQKMIDIWVAHLGDSLSGVYLHGSIALKCFVEGTSDVDILVVSERKIKREERLSIARDMIPIDGMPSPLEMSAIWIDDLVPWKYPTPCQFHYSDGWTERYKMMLSGERTDNFIIDEDFEDPDIACHVHLTNQSGICVYGKPIKEVFPPIPEQDFWKSISADIEDYDFDAYNPRYFTSNIMLLGRVLSYKREKHILSKYDAALWTLHILPDKLRYIVDNAIKSWYFGEDTMDYAPNDIEQLRAFLINEILS